MRIPFAALALVSLTGLIVPPAGAQSMQVSKMALVTFDGDARIQASPEAVWAALTGAKTARSWCPMWKDAKDPQPLTMVGTAIGFTDDYGNSGKSVVLFSDPAKELRLAHVPDNGSYVCQTRITLAPDGTGTRVHLTEQYSDALDVPVDKDTAAKTKTELEASLAALKTLVEKK
jgi:uncharacterized protein YndB with AHSA1/START domain